MEKQNKNWKKCSSCKKRNRMEGNYLCEKCFKLMVKQNEQLSRNLF